MADSGHGDEFLEVLRRYWPAVMEVADADQREVLTRLVDGLELDDAIDIRAALADELMDLLPDDHPVIEALRGNVMYGTGVALDDVELSLRRLRESLRPPGSFPGGGADDSSLEGILSGFFGEAASEPAGAPGAPSPGSLDDFDRRVRANLRAFPAFTPAELGDDVARQPGLIRLPANRESDPAGNNDGNPDGAKDGEQNDDGSGVRLPAFQFDPQRRPRATVLQINTRLRADIDPWGVMCWWVYPHARLAAVPTDLLDVDEPLLTRAAAALLED
jgi:hypothetical protein